MCKLNGWKGCVCLLKELFLKIPEYFGTRPFSPLLELSIHRDGEIFILSCFYQHQRDNGVISPLSFGGYWGFHFAGWQATAADWMVARMGRLVSQGEKKTKTNCLAEVWNSLRDEAPVHHHAEGRRESAFFFTQVSLAAQQESLCRQWWLWMLAVLAVAVVAFLEMLVIECQFSVFQSELPCLVSQGQSTGTLRASIVLLE